MAPFGFGFKFGFGFGLHAAANQITYTLLAAANASNASPLTSLVGSNLSQVATSPVVIPDSTGTLITIAAGQPAIPGGAYSGGNWSAPGGVTATALASGLTRYTGGPAYNPGLGVLNRPALTNKVTTFKHTPTATTNATIAGGGSTPAVLSLAASAGAVSAATAAGIRGICAGNFFKVDNSAGDAVATLTFGGTVANTNKHSFSLRVFKDSGAGTTRVMLTSGTGAATVSGTGFTRYAGENLTPSGTTQNLVLEVGIGDVVHCILPNLTETTTAPLWPIVATTDAASAVTAGPRYTTAVGSEFGKNIRGQLVLNELGREQWVLGNTHASDGGLYVNAANMLVWRGQSLGADLVDTMNTAAAWTVGSGTTATDDAGEVRIDFASGGSSNLYFREVGGLTTNLTVGKVYRINGEIRVASGTSLALYIAPTSSPTITSTTKIPFSFIFTATSATINSLSFLSAGAGEQAWISNVTFVEVKELTSTDALVAGTIYDWGVSNDTTGATLYIGGTAVATDATMTTPVSWGATVQLGANGSGASVWNGTISVLQSSSDAGFSAGTTN